MYLIYIKSYLCRSISDFPFIFIYTIDLNKTYLNMTCLIFLSYRYTFDLNNSYLNMTCLIFLSYIYTCTIDLNNTYLNMICRIHLEDNFA